MAHVFCTRCGQENPQDAHFCARCGEPLAAPGRRDLSPDATSTLALGAIDSLDTEPDEEPAELAAEILPPGSALLVVKRGPNAGSRFLLDKEVTTVGRHPDSDIFLDDVTVSRRHAEFRRDGEGRSARFSVHDAGSLNGTYLTRERIDETALAGGDEVQIGKFRLVYLVGDGEEAR